MIGRVLVANRGEIARRVIRTCREMTIETVAVYADPDTGEPHALEADQSVRLSGSTALETYLDFEAVLGAASTSGADAVHPGYGFLSENAGFARAVIDAGLTWVGPSPDAIATMGSKLESKAIAEAAGIPILPSADLSALDRQAMIDVAAGIGYPVLVKASAGGGGKGMRVVRSDSELEDAVAGAKREALSAFGDDTVFLESYLDAPRHIEIQVVADSQGNIASLHERECSIQRRHQKIIEEAPSTALDPSLRAAMAEAAIAIARAVDYLGAGTVEFLFQEGRFWFLEMNTRIQVEHPVTEMVTGLDLVRLQIEIADGKPLGDQALRSTISGHAIEARLYAEEPGHDFLPVTGLIHRFSFPARDGLRVDSGVVPGSEVTVHFDPMLAKVIAHAEKRKDAAAMLATALRQAQIHGPNTNRDLLVRILESQDFLAGDTDTHFLEHRDLTASLVGEDEVRLAAVAAAVADRCHSGEESRVLASIPRGWRNSPGHTQHRLYRIGDRDLPVDYRNTREGLELTVSDRIDVVSASSGVVELSSGGETYRFEVRRVGTERFVDGPSGTVKLEAVPRFARTDADEAPGSLHAPMPGRVVRVEVSVGDAVIEGQILLVLEAMKMEHTLRAPTAGTVQALNASSGEQVEAGTVLIVVEAAPSISD